MFAPPLLEFFFKDDANHDPQLSRAQVLAAPPDAIGVSEEQLALVSVGVTLWCAGKGVWTLRAGVCGQMGGEERASRRGRQYCSCKDTAATGDVLSNGERAICVQTLTSCRIVAGVDWPGSTGGRVTGVRWRGHGLGGRRRGAANKFVRQASTSSPWMCACCQRGLDRAACPTHDVAHNPPAVTDGATVYSRV